MIHNTSNATASRYGRREALKLGGLTVSVAAIAAACGNDRTGDSAPGRVGYAPPIEELEDYAIDDAVMLRTASSLELTAVAVYTAVLGTGLLDDDLTTLVERLIEDHQMVADEMGQLTEAVDGVAWECTNPWYMDRTVEPLLAAVLDSDNPLRDIVNTAVVLENIAAATHQSPTIDGDGEAPNDPDGVPYKFAITSRFGSTGQVELIAGKADENGVRQTFILQTPSLNSWIYNELEPTC